MPANEGFKKGSSSQHVWKTSWYHKEGLLLVAENSATLVSSIGPENVCLNY